MDSESKRKAALRKVLNTGVSDAPVSKGAVSQASASTVGSSARKLDLLQAAAPLAGEPEPTPPRYTPTKSKVPSFKAKPFATKKTAQSTKSTAAPVATPKINTKAPVQQAFPLEGPWTDLMQYSLGPKRARAHTALLNDRDHPAARAIDMLRTRLLTTLAEHGWSRVAITSPTSHCGKGFVAAQLALSLSRHDRCRAIVMDLDMRRPSIAAQLGVAEPGDLAQVLTGERAMHRHLFTVKDPNLNIGANVAFGLNDTAQRYAAELLMEPRTHAILDKMHERYAPDVTLYNVPPILEYDDMVGFQKQVDGILLVIGGGETHTADIRKVHKIIGSDVPLLGVVLNRAEDIDAGWAHLRTNIRHKLRSLFRSR